GINYKFQSLFQSLCGLLRTVSRPIFVFNGPACPPLVNVANSFPSDELNLMKAFLDAFGFEVWQAPADASAELAYLNGNGCLQAVLTRNTSPFEFDPDIVLRIQQSSQGATVNVYDADHIAAGSVRLTRGGRLLVTMLCGGSYHMGIPECPTAVAYALARAGFGERLLDAAEQFSGPELVESLTGWRLQLYNELLTNNSGLLADVYPAAAASLADIFPSLDIAHLYAQPVVSEHAWPTGTIRNVNIESLARLCMATFGWTCRRTLCNIFIKHVWPGVCVRQLLLVGSLL
ncbi:hypothetical protein CPB83DRAFT_919641, partial [Crepidotus variabilis]